MRRRILCIHGRLITPQHGRQTTPQPNLCHPHPKHQHKIRLTRFLLGNRLKQPLRQQPRQADPDLAIHL